MVSLLVVMSLAPARVFAQQNRDRIPSAPEAFRHVAVELWNRRVVALADFAHENAYPFYTLTEVLTNWLDLAADKTVSLVLVLEETGQTAEILQEYLRTGQTEPILNHLLPYTSLDRLEFYQELRNFYVRLQRINEGRSEDRRIRFSIRGFEHFGVSGPADGTEPAYSSAAQAGEVANERDRRVVAGLTAHLKDHLSDQVLVFYGMDHLRTRPTRQSWAQRLFGSSQQWQPLGSLLRQQLGEEFLSVAQAPFPRAARNPRDPYHALTSRNVILKSADIPWKMMQIDPGNFDAVIFLNTPTLDEAHLLRYICSRRVLDCAIERLAASEGQKPDVFTSALLLHTKDSLRLLTGQEFETCAQWRQWLSQNPYDGSARLDSDAWRDTVWKELFPRVRFLQCIGIYWVGYPAEKEKAKDYLVRFSSKAFDDPALYLKWYRREYLRLAY
jgi:hypothetical protein